MMIPQAALTLLNETINSTISASQSLSESESNAGESGGFGPSGNEFIIAISSLTAFMLITGGYCIYKIHKETATATTTTPLLNHNQSSINSAPEEEELSCTDKMAIGCNSFWSKLGF